MRPESLGPYEANSLSKLSDLNPLATNRQIRRLLVTSGYVTLGRACSAAMTFAAIMLVARALTPETFGIFSVIWAYAVIVDRLVNCQSWQALIKFGTDALTHEDRSRYQQLVKISFLVDATTAVLGALIAVAGTPVLALIFGWDYETTILAAAFGLVVLFNLSGVPFAVLRMNDRFGAIVVADLLAAGCRLGLVLAAMANGFDLGTCIVIWIVCEFIGKGLLVAFTIRALGPAEVKRIGAVPLRGLWRDHRAFLGALFITNMEGVVRVVRETDTLLVAFFLGNAATGTYRIARLLGQMVTVYVDPIQQVIYPELSRLANRAERATFVELSRKSAYLMGATTGVLLIAFVMVGEPVLLFALGPAYAQAFPIAIWILAAMLVWSVAHPLTPGMMALGAFRSFLWRNAAVTAFYIPALILFCILFGLHGAGLAFLLLYCAWFTLMLQSQTRNLENMIETRRKAIELED